MAHDLNFNKQRGTYSFASAKELAWHKLGTVVDNAMTSEEAIRLANLDYNVKLAEKVAIVDGPQPFEEATLNNIVVRNTIDNQARYYKGTHIANSYATFRDDTFEVLGEVKSRYNIIQNTEAFDFFDTIVQSKQAIFETAGALGKGETIFISAKLPSSFTVGKDDIIDKYLLLHNSHDGSSSINIMFTPVRVVCHNTLSVALKDAKNKISIRHTANAQDKLKLATNLLGLAEVNFTQLGAAYQMMSETKITDTISNSIIHNLFLTPAELSLIARNSFKLEGVEEISSRKKNIIADVKRYAAIGVGQQLDTTKGTLYGAFNGITGYLQNAKLYSNDTAKYDNIINGEGAKLTTSAFDLCMTLVN